MGKIALKLNRSSGTVQRQIIAHNSAIEPSGFCAKCRRMKGDKPTEKV